jgi:hypothetical protein
VPDPSSPIMVLDLIHLLAEMNTENLTRVKDGADNLTDYSLAL